MLDPISGGEPSIEDRLVELADAYLDTACPLGPGDRILYRPATHHMTRLVRIDELELIVRAGAGAVVWTASGQLVRKGKRPAGHNGVYVGPEDAYRRATTDLVESWRHGVISFDDDLTARIL